jgi:hypothetical protein
MKKALLLCLLFSFQIGSAQTIVGKTQVGSLRPTSAASNLDSLRDVSFKGTNQVNAYTPFLTADVTFIDSTGKNMLSADGSAQVLVTLKNIGGKPAEDCRVELVPSVNNSDIYITQPPVIKQILPNQELSTVIKLKASHLYRPGE